MKEKMNPGQVSSAKTLALAAEVAARHHEDLKKARFACKMQKLALKQAKLALKNAKREEKAAGAILRQMWLKGK